MKALVKSKAAPGLWLEDVPKPAPGIDDVLIRILRTAICGTDVHIYKWDDWARKTVPVPLVTGHEYSGEIAAIGADVRNLAIGQRVSDLTQYPSGRPIESNKDYIVAGWASVTENVEGPPVWDLVERYVTRVQNVRIEPNTSVKVVGI